MPTLFSYCIPYDLGSAPNPYWGKCTLVICKPSIRQEAEIGDWIVGTGSARSPLGDVRGKVVYAMRVTEIMSMKEYDKWCKVECPGKIPMPNSQDRMLRVGDCIYDFSSGRPQQRLGVHNKNDKERDLSGLNALISDEFYYFGDKPIDLPKKLLPILKKGPGIKSKANAPYFDDFSQWIHQFKRNTLFGNPAGPPKGTEYDYWFTGDFKKTGSCAK